MKKGVFTIIILVLSLLSCKESSNKTDDFSHNKHFGEAFQSEGQLSQEVFRKKLEKESALDCVIGGMVVSICKNESCDFRITMFDGRDIAVQLSGVNVEKMEELTDQNIVLKGKATLSNNQVTFVATGIEILA